MLAETHDDASVVVTGHGVHLALKLTAEPASFFVHYVDVCFREEEAVTTKVRRDEVAIIPEFPVSALVYRGTTISAAFRNSVPANLSFSGLAKSEDLADPVFWEFKAPDDSTMVVVRHSTPLFKS